MDATEENKLREKWFETRKEEQGEEDQEDLNDPNYEVDEYSAGCELISLRDLFTVHLLKIVSSLASKLLAIDEIEFRNMLYTELKFMDILNEDALELIKKRANKIFNKLYQEKFRLHTKKQKKRQQSNVIIEDLLYKPNFASTENQFFKLIETTKKASTPTQEVSYHPPKAYSESIEMIEEKEGDGTESFIGSEEKDEERKDETTPPLPILANRVSSTDAGSILNLPKMTSKTSTTSLAGMAGSGVRHSRYREDFEEIEFLGRGGSSEVVKVRNKLDGRFYAVKKIIIKQGQRLTRMMREVQTLSRLHHQNIIRYYQAWLEEVQDSENIDFDMADLDDEEEEEPDSDSQSFNLSGFSSGYSESFTDNPDRVNFQFLQFSSEKKILRLYIQTEYCQQALRTSLVDAHLDAHTIWRFFRQILEALAYIHSQKVIHRDLKPENIFLGINGDIKIGDFGLATKTHNLQTNENNKINHILNLKKSQVSEKELVELDKTMNVGTYFYRAYEMDRKDVNTYDEKVDVFSLGIILFEMWHPFASRYERYKILYDLKHKRKLPVRFEEAHPRQSRLIKLMLERNPIQRPNVAEILNNDLLPPKMEDDYMNDVIKSVSNPNTIFYKKLIEALFQIKGPESSYNAFCSQSLWEATYNENQEVFINLITQKMAGHFVSIGALPTKSPLFNKLGGGSSSSAGIEGYGLYENDPRVFYLNKLGYLEYLRINPHREFEQILRNLNPKLLSLNFFKSFEITDVFSTNNLEGIQKHTLFNYDSLMLLPEYQAINIAETVFLNIVSLDRQFSSLQNNSQMNSSLLKVKFIHMSLVKMLFQAIKVTNKTKMMQVLRIIYEILHNELPVSQAKTKIQQIIPLSDRGFEKLVTFFSLNGTLEQCKKSFESLLSDQDKLSKVTEKLEKLFKDIKDMFDIYKQVMKEKQKSQPNLPDFEIDMSLLDPEFLFKKDIYYEIRYKDLKHNRYELLSFGGVYKVQLTKPETEKLPLAAPENGRPKPLSQSVKGNTSTPKKSDKKKEVCGFSIYIEKLSRIMYGGILKSFQTDKSNKIISNGFFKYEVMICSLGGDPSNIKGKISMVCWQLKIPNLLYITGDSNTSLEEQLECAEKNDINLVIIIKEKIYATKNKVSLRWKKEKNKIEKEYTLDELIAFLSKSYKSGSAILSTP